MIIVRIVETSQGQAVYHAVAPRPAENSPRPWWFRLALQMSGVPRFALFLSTLATHLLLSVGAK